MDLLDTLTQPHTPLHTLTHPYAASHTLPHSDTLLHTSSNFSILLKMSPLCYEISWKKYWMFLMNKFIAKMLWKYVVDSLAKRFAIQIYFFYSGNEVFQNSINFSIVQLKSINSLSYFVSPIRVAPPLPPPRALDFFCEGMSKGSDLFFYILPYNLFLK